MAARASARQAHLGQLVRLVVQRHGEVGEVGVGGQAERLDALADRLGRPAGLLALVGDVGDEADAERLRDERVAAAGRPDLAVAALGGWRSGPPLAETPLPVWREVVEANLLPHVVAARTFLPALAGCPGARYVVVVGDTAERPVPGAAPVSVVSSAVLALARAAAVEVPEVAVTPLVLGVVRTRDRPQGRDEWVTADDVGQVVAELAAGRRAPDADGTVRLLDRSALRPGVSAGAAR